MYQKNNVPYHILVVKASSMNFTEFMTGEHGSVFQKAHSTAHNEVRAVPLSRGIRIKETATFSSSAMNALFGMFKETGLYFL